MKNILDELDTMISAASDQCAFGSNAGEWVSLCKKLRMKVAEYQCLFDVSFPASLRDWFARMAMQGLCANADISKYSADKKISASEVTLSFSVSAYAIADNMLAQRAVSSDVRTSHIRLLPQPSGVVRRNVSSVCYESRTTETAAPQDSLHDDREIQTSVRRLLDQGDGGQCS